MTTARTWIDRFAEAIGAPPLLDDEIDALLALAGVAAHASERTAAPVATWLAGRAGLSPAEAKTAAERLAAELDAEA